MEHLTVGLGNRSYPIYLGDDALGVLPRVLSDLSVFGTVAIVTDTNVAPLYGDRITELVRQADVDARLCTIPAGEQHKRLEQVDYLCGEFLDAGLDRSSVVLALGGGVVGDIAGYAAASYMRGIRHVQVPTTIVAQVDSSVGGKTGVNHARAKNIIGAFHQPSAVVIDLTLLKTLPERELRAGLAEVIKHGIIADAILFSYMEEQSEAVLAGTLHVLQYPVKRSCEIKSAIVSADERELGLRANLNYGHTFGHGIEAASGYKTFLHGEAISLGMIAAGTLARNLGLVGDEFVQRQERCLVAYGLPVRWPEIPIDQVIDAMRHDKKAQAGTLKFVVADEIGHVVQRTDVSIQQARTALESLRG
ncbi:MAG: 3-dehydroquinate synthase [Candidatus Hydrogenedentota bacterium]